MLGLLATTFTAIAWEIAALGSDGRRETISHAVWRLQRAKTLRASLIVAWIVGGVHFFGQRRA